MEALHWRTHLHPVLAAALILILVAWMIVLFRRQGKNRSWQQTVWLLLPKVLIVLLLILAYFDPIRRVIQPPQRDKKILVLIDDSSSMACEDRPGISRAQRAQALSLDLTGELSDLIDIETLRFATDIDSHTERAASEDGIRGTNIGKSLVSAGQRAKPSEYLATLLLTDGGDEFLRTPQLPRVPLHVASLGTTPDSWNDLSIKAIDVPAVVEAGTEFEVKAELLGRFASQAFQASVTTVPVRLEERVEDDWQVRKSQFVHFEEAAARADFTWEAPSEPGIKTFRVRAESVPGELSDLNNTRHFNLDVREDTLHVLFFAQELGWDFSMIRKALARDPSVELTALFRVTEARFIVQGTRQAGDEQLTAGFPQSKAVLDLFQCVIVGSFAASQWQPSQFEALVEYVRDGGAVIFLGGEQSFGLGRYAGTPIEPLFPWRLYTTQSDFQIGQFNVKVPAIALGHPIMTETGRLIAQLDSVWVESANLEGPAKGGAVTLLEAQVGARTVPLVSIQRFGRGQSMAIATNTLWKWRRVSPELQAVHSLFWQQSVKNMTDWNDSQRFISVKWDQSHYQPGEQGRASIRVAGRHENGQLHLRAEAHVEGDTSPVAVEPVMGSENTYAATLDFTKRANYTFHLQALTGSQLLETYEKTLVVGATLNEGVNLEVDHAFLSSLSAQGNGMYFPEEEFGSLIETLRAQLVERSVDLEIPLIEDRCIYALVFMGVLILEWIIRRRMNLL
jgi:uncharacterized membrane protein